MTTSVSIIIPTYNRVQSLIAALKCIGRQTHPFSGLEVIVVDDGSTDATPERASDSYPFTLRYFRQANRGATTARNAGAVGSQGDVLILLDDDVLIAPGFVGGLVREHEAHDRVVGLGTFQPYHTSGESTFRRIYAELTATQDVRVRASFLDCTSNAFSVRREHFFEIGKMQDLIGDGQALWGDVDFGYRAHRMGFAFRRNPAATCYHDDYAINHLDVYANRAEKIASWAVALVRKYPELDGRLPMLSDKRPIALGEDGLRLIGRKTARAFASARLSLALLEHSARWLGAHTPREAVLRILYRWVVGGHIYRGYRRGLRDYTAPRTGSLSGGDGGSIGPIPGPGYGGER